MSLPTLWFCLIALLWCGYFVLEGFDFGAAMLMPTLAKYENERRVILNTFGPVWDGYEVWLLVAGGATFAAFPEWYATMFSGFYLPLLLILVALIARGVAFEYRGKIDSAHWRRRWDLAIFWGSARPSLLWGVAFGNVVRGVPLDARHEYTGNLFTLLNPYALIGGATTLTLFLLHGAVFLSLRTTGEIRTRARHAVTVVGGPAVGFAVVFLVWTEAAHHNAAGLVLAAAAAVALLAGIVFALQGREGRAFAATAITLVLAVATLFRALYPNVLRATTDAHSLTVTNASSTHHTLAVMTGVALVLTPLVLAYQAWTYWVFRTRIGVEQIPPVPKFAWPVQRDQTNVETPQQSGTR
jgi:cytochrome d ubiquinol oxidase subunit II